MINKLLAFVSACILFIGLSTYASAQTVEPNIPQGNINALSTQMTTAWISNVSCMLTGVDPMGPEYKCLSVQPDGTLSYLPAGGPENPQGLLGFFITNTDSLMHIPARSSHFIGYLQESFGLPTAYAQPTGGFTSGIGFNGLAPLLPIWAAFRNIAYLFITIIFVLIGFAIMFRVKIDARTVMNIENQIPKLIAVLILITFSYAIAGLAVDAMYVTINVLHGVISGIRIDGVNISNMTPDLFFNNNPLGLLNYIASPDTNLGISGVATGIAYSLAEVIRNIFGISEARVTVTSLIDLLFRGSEYASWADTYRNNLGINATIDILSLIVSIFSGNAVGGLTNIPFIGSISAWAATLGFYELINISIRTGLPGLLIYLVIIFSVVILMFRLWFSLLMSYVYVILDIILAPLWILMGVLPGSEVKFESWLRDLVANLLAFPVVIAMFMLTSLLSQALGGQAQDGSVFIPPLIGNPGSDGRIPLSQIITVAMILITPNILGTIKEFLKVKENKLGAAAAQNLSVGGNILTTTGKNVGVAVTPSEYSKEAPGPLGVIRKILN
jgi:hypothetical protein